MTCPKVLTHHSLLLFRRTSARKWLQSKCVYNDFSRGRSSSSSNQLKRQVPWRSTQSSLLPCRPTSRRRWGRKREEFLYFLFVCMIVGWGGKGFIRPMKVQAVCCTAWRSHKVHQTVLRCVLGGSYGWLHLLIQLTLPLFLYMGADILLWNVMQQVLQQQRVEQQRIQQQQQGNQGVDTDPATFINMLPPQLRQQVLSDMDDSQMPTLPADIAAEARELRQELEDRHRRVMQERLFAQGGAASLSAILRNPGMCVSVSGWLVMYSVNRNQKVLFFVLFSCRFFTSPAFAVATFCFCFYSIHFLKLPPTVSPLTLFHPQPTNPHLPISHNLCCDKWQNKK